MLAFCCWPHRLDEKRDRAEFQFFVRKNRNRPINQMFVQCRFDPSRQMVLPPRPADRQTTVHWTEGRSDGF